MESTSETRTANRREQAQGIVEFSMVITLLLLLVFGIIDFSRLFFAYATMSNGVREGARYGIVNPGDDTGVESHARAMMIIIGGDADITSTYPDLAPDPNKTDAFYSYCPHLCRIVVEARHDFDAWTPLIPTFEIVTQATMHIE